MIISRELMFTYKTAFIDIVFSLPSIYCSLIGVWWRIAKREMENVSFWLHVWAIFKGEIEGSLSLYVKFEGFYNVFVDTSFEWSSRKKG